MFVQVMLLTELLPKEEAEVHQIDQVSVEAQM